jgi:CHAT domain-containing protein
MRAPYLPMVIALLLITGCQSTMSIDEAKRVTATFSGTSFVPPPRTISDVTTILAQPPSIDRVYLGSGMPLPRARVFVDEAPPATSDSYGLARFFYRRGMASRQTGRAKQEKDDLVQANTHIQRVAWRRATPDEIERAESDLHIRIPRELARAEAAHGDYRQALAHFDEAIHRVPLNDRSWLVYLNAEAAAVHAERGDLAAAEAATREVVERKQTAVASLARFAAIQEAYASSSQAAVFEIRGRLAEAETFWRRAVDVLAADATTSRWTLLDLTRSRLARTLARAGRLMEAEVEARKALTGSLDKVGRDSAETAAVVQALTIVLTAQGRYPEAEQLARATLAIYDAVGGSPEGSIPIARARLGLASVLAAQGRWIEAIQAYDQVRRDFGDDATFLRLIKSEPDYLFALVETGRSDEASVVATTLLVDAEATLGRDATTTAVYRTLRGVARAARGEQALALADFATGVGPLLTRQQQFDDETARTAADLRRGRILSAYVRLLAAARGTPVERAANLDATTESFRIADVVRGQSVQRALDASAARLSATTPALADIARREQDARKQLVALHGLLANVLSAPADQQNSRVVENLRLEIGRLAQAHTTLTAQITREFPAYAALLNPPVVSLADARAALRDGEALITTLTTRDRTFVWAVPRQGPVGFVAAPLGEEALATAVRELRASLEPKARLLGDLPAFDVARAHELYRALLEPVKASWETADSLQVATHGALAQLPFALLPTRPVSVKADAGLLFSGYRAVPWLARSHAVTVVPSVTAMVTLRAFPAGATSRRAFIGFGDPYFSVEQASRAARREAIQRSSADDHTGFSLRNLGFDRLASARLGTLPRLPDTRAEILDIARVLEADLARDVFLGERANEKNATTTDLAAYRVVAFATHGLLPGDLDGLTQPALALTAPEVAHIDGDGLLTMEKILGLRLDADWVVLSACNSAAASGNGAESISGLGRAFFYAGARALLVSNWPVETTSARVITTDLFRRQKIDPGLTRAKNLRETMNWIIDEGVMVDPVTKKAIFSYAHPIFWAPFTLVGDGGGGRAR